MGSIYWILVGPEQAASSRIHGFRVHEYLLTRGWRSTILFAPPCWTWDPPLDAADFQSQGLLRPGDVLVCQKTYGPNTRAILAELKRQGVATIYVDCDLPLKMEEAGLATITLCSSRWLASEYGRKGIESVAYIPDAFEWSTAPRREDSRHRLQCVWFGDAAPERWAQLENFKTMMAAMAPRWDLIRVSNHPAAEVQWDLRTAWRVIAGGDVAILPGCDADWERAKSANRAIQAMALGIPVAAHPTPACSDLIRSGRNGFLCSRDQEWLAALQQLEDPVERRRVALLAWRHVRRFYGMERIGPGWEDLFARCGLPRPNGQEQTP